MNEVILYILVVNALLSLLVGKIAGKMNRSSIAWFFLSTLVSPLIAGLLLALAGRAKATAATGAEGAADLSNLSDEEIATIQAHRARQTASCVTLPKKIE